MCMRNVILGAAVVALMADPALAERLSFSADTFVIYGGLSNSPVRQARRSYHGKRMVDLATSLAPGSVIVRTAERKLYYVMGQGRAIEYAVGVGREGFTWS